MANARQEIADGVLHLNRFTFADVDAVVAGEDQEHARRFGWHPARSTRESVEATVRRWDSDWNNNGQTRAFAARQARSGVLVGGCEVRLGGGGGAEMSYWVFPLHRLQGHGTRIVKLAAAYVLANLDVQRISAFVQPDNLASLAVARKAGCSEVGKTRQSIGAGTPPVDVIEFELSVPRGSL